MRTIFILDYSFPSPTAPSNRIAALIKSLKEKDVFVDVICLNGTYRNESEVKDYKDTNVIYLNSKFRARSKFKRIFLRLCSPFTAMTYIINANRKFKIHNVFIPVNHFIVSSSIFILSKFINFKIIQERSEYPEVYNRNYLEKFEVFLYKKFTNKFLDGIVLMTYNLEKHYRSFLKRNTSSIVIPMSVDFDRFKYDKKEQKQQYLAYCGNVSNKKDGVDILIKSFAKISSKFPDLKLYIIGGSSDKNLLNELEEICKELNVKEKVVFTGKVSAEDMPDYLINASVLALARPTSLQASGGFPTKLGEYLATKNPVVVKNVGEISSYLKDGESAYISAPDSVEQFASKLDECLSNFERSKKIGEKGYEVAKKYFDYRSQSDALSKFLYELGKK
jgi:glycosyltransferase involved in cell wall biosynthesis